MRVALALSVISVALGLSAAAAQAQTVARGNDTGGIIAWSCENEAAAQAIAAAHCGYYGKYQRISSVHRQYGDYIAFNCLWNPRQAQYAMPALPTRSACFAVAKVPYAVKARHVVRARY